MRHTFRFYTGILVLLAGLVVLASETNYSKVAEFEFQPIATNAELDHDVAAVNLVAPPTVTGGKMQLLQAVIENVGANAESLDVEFGYLEWDSTFVVKRTKTVDELPPGERKNVSFGFYTFPANVEYDYFIRIVLPGDMNPDNDVVTQAISSFENSREVVLIEKFTGTWCSFCPGAARCVDQLYKDFPGQLAAIDYHIGDPYENAQCRPRDVYYKVNGYPTTKFNGISEHIGGGSAYGWEDLYRDTYKPRFRAALNHGTCLDMTLHYEEDNGTIKAQVELMGLGTSYVRSYRLFYVVVESHIEQSWGGLDSLQHVFRGVYPDWNGVPFIKDEHIEEGVTFSSEIEFEFPQNVIQEHSSIFAFVQNPENGVVMATAIGEEVEPIVNPFDVTVPHTAAMDTAGNEIIFDGMVHNLLETPLTVDFKRTLNDVPDDWSSALCLDVCLAPWVDETSATIPAGDSLEFSLHVFTGARADSGTVNVTIADSTGVKMDSLTFTAKTIWPTNVEDKPLARTFELLGNYPNPFNPTTTIEYSVADMCTAARLQVYSLRGRRVAEVPLNAAPGVHQFEFQAAHLSAGLYLYRIVFETTTGALVSEQRKFTVLK